MLDALFALTGRLGLDGLMADMLAASLKASLLLLAALLVTVAWRGASAANRHFIWTLALGGALVMPFASRLLPRIELRHLPDVASRWSTPTAATAEVSMTPLASGWPLASAPASTAPTGVETATVRETVPLVRAPGLTEGHTTALALAAASEAAARRGAIDPSLPYRVSIATGGGSPRVPDAPFAPRWRSLLVALWAIGAALVLVPVMLGRLRVLLLAKRARPLGEGAWSDLVEIAIARTGLARDVRVLESDDSTMPMTWGVVRPTVLLPAAAESWTEQQRQDVLLHELAHVARLDCLTQVIAQLACAVHWFNPLVWLAARRMCVEREHACDDRVLAAGARPSDYASHLLEVARSMRVGSVAPLGAVAMARRAQLSERLLAVLDATRPRAGVSRRFALPAWLLASALVLVVGALAPAGVDAASPQSTKSIGDALLLAPSDTDSVAAVAGSGRKPGDRREPAAAAGEAPAAAAGTAQGAGWGAGGPAQGAQAGSGQGASAGGGQGAGGAAASAQGGSATAGAGQGGGSTASINGVTVKTSGGQSITADDGVIKVDGKVVVDEKHVGPLVLGSASTSSPQIAAAATRASRQECGAHKSSSNHIMVDDDGKKEMKVSWKTDRCSVSIEIEGDVTIAPDLTDIVSVSRGSYVEIVERTSDVVRRLEIRNRSGDTERKYTVDGETRPWNADGQRWLAGLLVDLERRTGTFAKSRVAQIFENGGGSAVLAEIDRLTGDYAKRRYFTELFDRDINLDDAFIGRAIGQAAQQIDSDYELRVVLSDVADEKLFADAATLAFANAVRSLQSDYERRVAITTLVSRNKQLPSSALRAVIGAAQSTTSPYEMRVILTTLADQRALDAELLATYVEAVGRINSDYERRVALTAILERELDARALAAVFRASRTMTSDYERRLVLTAAVKGRTLGGEALREFDAAVDAMTSDYERGLVLNAARKQSRTSEM